MATPSIAMIPSGYKDGKVYSVLPNSSDGDFNFTRGSAGTRINAQGLIEEITDVNSPRLDYSDGSCPSLLLEPQSTNLIPYSEDFTESGYGWNYSADALELTESNSIISPDGTQSADKISKTAVRIYAYAYRVETIISGQPYSWSMFMKKGTHDIGYLSLSKGDTDYRAYFDLTNGTSGMFTGSANTNIEDVGNGWFRCSLQGVFSTTDVVVRFNFGMSYSTSIENWPSASEGEGLYAYFWGAQLEAGSYPTSYIPTNGSIATRLADQATGSGNSSLINSTEGVLYAEIAALAENSANRRFITLNDGTASNGVVLRYEASGIITARYQVSGTAQCSIAFSTTITNFHKIAFKYSLNNFALWVDGVEVGADNSGSVLGENIINNIDFDSGNGSFPFYGKSRALAVFPILTNAELQSLTTI